uniref:Uncharacterized protein n=1 Tax=Anguilla anguilla TaxID=7936 RepID=A0A0E9VJ86_ANGAN
MMFQRVDFGKPNGPCLCSSSNFLASKGFQ